MRAAGTRFFSLSSKKAVSRRIDGVQLADLVEGRQRRFGHVVGRLDREDLREQVAQVQVGQHALGVADRAVGEDQPRPGRRLMASRKARIGDQAIHRDVMHLVQERLGLDP
jgi:hypothetical protein